jgi:hypothetical protein
VARLAAANAARSEKRERTSLGGWPHGERAQQAREGVAAAADAEGKLPAVVDVGDEIEALRQAQRRAGGAARPVAAGSQMAEVGLDAGRFRGLGPGAGDVEAAVVVTAAAQRLEPGRGAGRHQPVALRELGDDLGGERAQQQRREIVQPAIVNAVASLEAVEQHDQLLELRQAQPVVDPVERVGDRMGDVLGDQVVAELVEVAAQLLDHAVLGFVDSPSQTVDLATVLGEADGDLLGEEDSRQVSDLESAGDAVVVADGDELHAPFPAAPIDVARLGEALGRAELPENPLRRSVGVLAVDVEVGSRAHRGVLSVHPGGVPRRPGNPG